MVNIAKQGALVLFLAGWVSSVTGQSAAPVHERTGEQLGITQQQADAILEELRAIHRLLERDGRPAPTAHRVPVRVGFKLDPRWPAIGRDDAPLTLVQFNDYQCPYCRRFHGETFADIKKSFVDTGVLRVVFRDFPLGIHPGAVLAAEAGRCAADQGNFERMHDLLMTRRSNFAINEMVAYAEEVGLNKAQFKGCLEDHKYRKDVQQSASDALAQSITGTPTFVLARTSSDEVAGDVLTGALPFKIFESAIKRRLETK